MNNLEKIIVSACLLGEKVRYDGKDNGVASQSLARWLEQGRLVIICPEMAGGLPTPRPPAEIREGDGYGVIAKQSQIFTNGGDDVTAEFLQGAKITLELALKHKCRFALLAARSPSCGNQTIYDGTFTNQLKTGLGVTAALLQENGIEVFNQDQIGLLEKRIGSQTVKV